MENMNIRSSKSNPASVLGTDKPEKILHLLTNIKSHATARGDMSGTNKPAGPSDQVSIVQGDEKPTEFRGSFSLRAELQSLLATKLSNLCCFALKGEMMQGIEDTLTDAVEIGVLATDTAVKHAFFLLHRDGDNRHDT